MVVEEQALLPLKRASGDRPSPGLYIYQIFWTGCQAPHSQAAAAQPVSVDPRRALQPATIRVDTYETGKS